jgi:hypothetical protein
MSEPTLSGNQELVGRELTERFQARTNPFKLRNPEEAARQVNPQMHVYGPNAQCITDTSLGKATPQDSRDPLELVVGVGAPGEGIIPLWEEGTTLRWRFRERSLILVEDPEGAKTFLQELLGAALLAWGDAAPVRFVYGEDRYDFEIALNWASDCTISNGSRACTLARAFFPARAQETLWLYPELFEQSAQEMIETIVHELGHCFGLRHYFAPEKETGWPAVVFGTHKPFSIMNYGSQSVLTEADRDDLKRLYEAAWSGKINNISGLPIRLVKPLSAI